MSMSITFTNTENEYYAVNKTYTTVTTKSGASIVYPCDILAPTLKIKGGKIDANAVTGLFGRNYWITGQTLNEGINYVSLKVDAFSSWKNNINDTEQFVTRSEKYGNPYINDNSYACTSEPVSMMYDDANTVIVSGNLRYVLGVI